MGRPNRKSSAVLLSSLKCCRIKLRVKWKCIFARCFGSWEKLISCGADWEQALNIELPVLDEALLEMKRSAGAEVSPEYVLQFSKEVRGEIEARYRRSAMMLADRMLEALGAQGEAALQALDASRAAVLAQSAAAARCSAPPPPRQQGCAACCLPSGLLPEVHAAQEPSEAHGSDPASASAAQPQTEAPPRKAAAHRQPAAGAQRRRRLDAAAARLEAAAALVEPYPAMGSAVRICVHARLRLRAARLPWRCSEPSAPAILLRQRVAGRSCTPVSPHPTTAAINRSWLRPERGWNGPGPHEDPGRVSGRSGLFLPFARIGRTGSGLAETGPILIATRCASRRTAALQLPTGGCCRLG